MTANNRARARFGAYAAFAVVTSLVAAILPEYRLVALILLVVAAFWWLRLDPVGPEGDEIDAAAHAAGLAIRLRAWLERKF